MIVVSDTSCVSNLIALDALHLLPALYGEVIIPLAVERELRRTHGALPGFLQLRQPGNLAFIQSLAQQLDRGEAEAIALAKELHADRLLIDEKDGRAVALREHIPVIGVLGILLIARKRGMIPSIKDCLLRLEQEAGFYKDEALKASVLQAAGEEQ
jgi:predicted nucleic acid-binding protein